MIMTFRLSFACQLVSAVIFLVGAAQSTLAATISFFPQSITDGENGDGYSWGYNLDVTYRSRGYTTRGGHVLASVSLEGRGVTVTAEASSGCLELIGTLCDVVATAKATARYDYSVQAILSDDFFAVSGAAHDTRVPLIATCIATLGGNSSATFASFAESGIRGRSPACNARPETVFVGANAALGVSKNTFEFYDGADFRLYVEANAATRATRPGDLFAQRVDAFADPSVTIDPDWQYISFASLVTIKENLAPSISNSTGITISSVPLPPSAALLGLGLFLLARLSISTKSSQTAKHENLALAKG